MKSIIKFIVFTFIICFSNHINAQFYYGLQQPFGKNRVQYNNFLWSYYEFKKFDTYFYTDGKNIAEYIGRFAENHITEIETLFDATLNEKLEIILFNSLSDLKQSNINHSDEENFNTGGITHISGNRMSLYFNGSYIELEEQLRRGITEIILNKMIYGDKFRQAIKNNALVNFPEWYTKGLISYIGNQKNQIINNYVRDGIISGKYKSFNSLIGQDAIYAGHSIWEYIAETYGKKLIGNIMYMSILNKNIDGGFMFVLGKSLNEISKDWYSYYSKKYINSFSPELEKKIIHSRKNHILSNITMNSDNSFLSYTTHNFGKYKIWIYDVSSKKKTSIHKGGNQIPQNADYSFPLLSFHPKNNLLAFVTEKKGSIWLNFYDLLTKKTSKKSIYYFEKIHSFSYSKDGKSLVISATKNGQSDIFTYNISSNTYQRITNDIFDDLSPTYLTETRIIFSSNRLIDSLKKSSLYHKGLKNLDLYLFENKFQNNLRKLTDFNYTDKLNPKTISDNQIAFINQTQKGNIRQILELDSSIAFIDTSIHYNYISRIYNPDNTFLHIFDYEYNNNNFYDSYMDKNRFKVYTTQLQDIGVEIKLESKSSKKDLLNNSQDLGDMILSPNKITKPDFDININNYEFEEELYSKFNFTPENKKRNLPDTIIVSTEPNQKKSLKKEFKLPKKRTYFTSFYANYFTTQIDNSYTFASYQPFSGGTSLFLNPSFNSLFELGISDIMEDYNIIGGIRLSFDLNNNEYYLKFQNHKNRLDKETIFYKRSTTQAIDEYGFYIVKSNIHHIKQLLSFPFNEVQSIRAKFGYRNDKNALLSTDYYSLNEPNYYDHWFTSHLEYVFDNTRLLQTNIYSGFRCKLFTEYYQYLNDLTESNGRTNTSMTTIGFDIRYYFPIHKNLILATRFAGATSLGKQKLIYYMGGVDNWISPQFNPETTIDFNQGYSFQTIATNMRGFHQNIRNGNSFSIINTELRWPIIKYLIKKPLKSEILSDFQIIGFFDIGSAWTGNSPYSDENSLNIEEIEHGPIYITLDKQIEPVVFGYGFGLRTTLLGYFVRLDFGWGREDHAKHIEKERENKFFTGVINFSFGIDF